MANKHASLFERDITLPFHSPATTMIVGPTMSDKTFLVYVISKHVDVMFQTPPEPIVIAYTGYQSLFEVMERNVIERVEQFVETCADPFLKKYVLKDLLELLVLHVSK